MAITYHNSASNPADNGTNATDPCAVTPPASMNAGDLVIMIAHSRQASNTYSISEASGQSWSQLTPRVSNTNISAQLFWCRFNGTWGANPSVSEAGGAANFSVVMHVFRPTDASYSWAVDNALVELDYTAPSTPFTVTITGVTTSQASTVSLAGWFTADDNTWGSLTGTGWVVTGSAQYRNVASTDSSATFAHNIQTSAGGTNNPAKNQATLGGDAGTTFIVSFYEFVPPDGPPAGTLAMMGVGL